MGESEKVGPLVKVEGEVHGVKVGLELSESVPGVLGKLLPKTWMRRTTDLTIHGAIMKKARDSLALNDAELDFMEATSSEAAVKYFRKQRILERGIQVLPEFLNRHDTAQQPCLLPASGPEASARSSETPKDWSNRFWEDAGLVDEADMQELYARILAQEAIRPGSFSLRTLSVLRSLDGTMARAFGHVVSAALDEGCIPGGNSEASRDLLDSIGLDHQTLADLDDCGLVKTSINSELSYLEDTQRDFVLYFPWQFAAYRITVSHQTTVRFPIYLLTPAGRQLSKIAQVLEAEKCRAGLEVWLHTHMQSWKRSNSSNQYRIERASTAGVLSYDEITDWENIALQADTSA